MNYQEFLRSEKSKVYFILEAGVNHEGSLQKAKEMVDLAAQSGADCIKFQTYKASTLASTAAVSYWDTNSEATTNQHDLFSKYDALDFDDYKELHRYCVKRGIEFSTSVFNYKEIEKYAPLLPFFKIASADITNFYLHEAISQQNKPVIQSVGAATLSEVDEVVRFYTSKNIHLTLLHCVLNYPCLPKNAHLDNIKYLRNVYPDIQIGYSDHVPWINNGLHLHLAREKGAKVIEKHFTYDKGLPGNDHYHSMDSNDMKEFRKTEQFVNELTIKMDPQLITQKAAILNARRSLVANKTLSKGHIISSSDFDIKRPGNGIEVKHSELIIGLELKKEVQMDNPLQWEDFK
ncbi:N-acetylneuraminate synthase family protein [Schleiferiaceae bacterium]|nr:N-acetylneuraminate synthase family protein [Schleiferiaceae bacterium]